MKRPARIAWSIWLIVALVVLGIAATVMAIIKAERRDAVSVAKQQAETVARAAEATVNRNLLSIDLMLTGLTHMPGLSDPDGRETQDLKLVSAGLRSRVNQSLIARDLVLIDRQGNFVASADPATGRLGLELPPDFLTRIVGGAVSQLVVSTPFTSASSAEKVLYLARPLGSIQNAALIALAEIPVATLSNIMSIGIATAGMTVTLEDDKGRLLASAPANDSMLAQINPLPLARLIDSAPSPGQALHMAGRLDGAPAFVSIRPSLYPDALVSAGLSEATALALNRAAAEQATFVGGGFALMTILIGALVQLALARMGRSSAEAARAKAVLEEALASMDEGFLLWDADDHVVSWNSRYLDIFPHMRGVIGVGVSLQEIVEVGARAHFPDADETERKAWAEQRVAQHYSDGREFELSLHGGQILSVVERRTANGGIVSVYRNITRAKATAQELLAARQIAEAGSEAKTRFLATMSHEIRTPLNGVLGMNGLLLETQLDERQRRYAETIRSSGEALLDILNDVLDMSKLEAGHMALELAPFVPASLVDEVVQLLRPRAEIKGISIGVSGTAGLPQLSGDAGRIRQVLFNLIGNAVKFTHRGGVMVRNTSKVLADGRIEWTITVSDTGIGIPADAVPTLFDRFTQADSSTSRRFGGTGLGLAISRQLVELMNGNIEMQSRVGEGSDFVVALPLTGVAQESIADVPAPTGGRPSTEPSSAERPSLRVLVAEDNRVNQMVMVAMLERLGHTVDVVNDGREAVHQLQQGRYDIVLMDIQMPEMDGTTATREIRKLPEPLGLIPIIAVSANVLPEQRATYLAAGMNSYLAKPFTSEQLEALIAEQMVPA